MAWAVRWQRVEGGLVFAAAVALCLFWSGPLAWWVAVLLFFAPDLSFAGYALGPRVGAACYNAVHVYGFGAGCLALGVFAGSPVVVLLGTLWLGHAGFDRMLGYGLKLPGGFAETHLGRIGPRR